MQFEHVTLWTGKLEETKDFYTQRLDLTLLEDRVDCFTVQIGSTHLTFNSTDEAKEDYSPFYHYAINIPENKFQEVKSWALSRLTLITEDGDDEIFFESWNANSIYFEDPSGNIVEFIARHHLNNGITHSFSAADLICISEIGIVTDEVIPYVRSMNERGISCWRDESETFTALGDENGLFIVVKTNREWYFSNQKKAHIYPVEVSIQGIGHLHL